MADTFAPVTSVAVLLEASRRATASDTTPVVLADTGVENVNAQIDALINTGVLRRLLAFTELTFSNSMIEGWWRSLNNNGCSSTRSTAWPRCVDSWRSTSTSITARLPDSACRGQTPDEMYFGTGDAGPADVSARAAAARRARGEANRSAACAACPAVDAAA